MKRGQLCRRSKEGAGGGGGGGGRFVRFDATLRIAEVPGQ